MKIAFDYQIFASQEHGGVSRYFARLAESLARDEAMDVEIAAPLHVNSYLSDVVAARVRGIRLPRWRGVPRLANPIDRTLAGMFPPRADILHETYYAAPPRRSGPARIVVTVHDLIHEKFPTEFAAGDLTAILKRAAIERADHICCVSESTRRDLLALYPGVAAKSSVTLLGFDQGPPRPPQPRPAGRPYLLFVGQRRGYKNFSGLLAAYAASAALRAEFDILAIGGGNLAPTERAAMAALGIADRVRHARATDAELAEYYAGAACFVYPSMYEGFGIPPLEAMAAGTPVVACDISSVPEVCGDAAAYAPPGDDDALRGAIEGVVFSPERRAALIAAGQRRLARFSWSRCAADTAAVYRSLA